MEKSTFVGIFKCPVCGKEMSNAGAGRTAHMRKHVKEGTATEDKDPKTGKLVFTSTGKEPEIPGEINWETYEDRSAHRGGKYSDPRIPVNIRIYEDKFQIQCRKCKKWINARQCNADERFLAVSCKCDKKGHVTLASKRFISKAEKTPGTVLTI